MGKLLNVSDVNLGLENQKIKLGKKHNRYNKNTMRKVRNEPHKIFDKVTVMKDKVDSVMSSSC
jgi:hypothetical protein